MPQTIAKVEQTLEWMRANRIWPNGMRYLWTDAFGVVLLVSLYRALERGQFLDQARWVVAEVERVLGRRRGFRIGEAPDRDGQYYHYLAMWVYALSRLGKIDPVYRAKAVRLVKDIHSAFVIPGRGVHWKMREDLSAPYSGFGLGALDHFHGYVVYRLLDEAALAGEIGQMKLLVERSFQDLAISQDLGLGMMLWMTHFFPEEEWARVQRDRSLKMLDRLWIDPPGYFCREPAMPEVKFAFTNYGVSIGLQAVEAWPERVARLNSYFERYRSGDEYDFDAITHVMACGASFPGEFIAGGE
ncbi:MAG TPA: hypothetical protein VNF27_15055 [Candidatus Binataceae bacterium]|nr:hypothetical protein [Candidatus Binataceae bacterium]